MCPVCPRSYVKLEIMVKAHDYWDFTEIHVSLLTRLYTDIKKEDFRDKNRKQLNLFAKYVVDITPFLRPFF